MATLYTGVARGDFLPLQLWAPHTKRAGLRAARLIYYPPADGPTLSRVLTALRSETWHLAAEGRCLPLIGNGDHSLQGTRLRVTRFSSAGGTEPRMHLKGPDPPIFARRRVGTYHQAPHFGMRGC